MNGSPENDRDIENLKAQLRALEMRKPFLKEVLIAFGQLLTAGAGLRAELEALPEPELGVSGSEELSAGVPLLSGVRFQKTDLPPVPMVKEMLLAVGTAFPALRGDTDRLLECLEEDPGAPGIWLETLLQNREQSLTASAAALGLAPEVFRFALERSFKPFLQWLGTRLSHHIEQIRWDRGHCPVCGARPDTSCLKKPSADPGGLTGHGGRRWLHCSRCSFEWRLHRVACPHCGNEDARSLKYFSSAESPHERLYVCHRCKRYLTCLDTTELIEAPLSDLIPFELLHLDVIAVEKGFKPATRLPMGV